MRGKNRLKNHQMPSWIRDTARADSLRLLSDKSEIAAYHFLNVAGFAFGPKEEKSSCRKKTWFASALLRQLN